MESQEQREERKEEVKQKKSGGKIAALLVSAAIIGGGVYAYTQGLFPGVGASKTAEELKAEIEALKGSAIEAKALASYEKSPLITEEDKQKVRDSFANDFDITFDYKALATKSGEGKGTVEITQPLLTVVSLEKNEPGYISAPKLIISRSADDSNHYFYSTEGDVEIYGEVAGTKTKLVSFSGEQPYNELKISEDGMSGYFKSSSKNLRVIEGRGNTVLATIGETLFESSQKRNGQDMDLFTKLSLKNIVPGDMAKMMLGNVEPITFSLDYEYKGDDINQKLQQFIEKPNATPADIQPFNGSLKLKDLTLLMGDAGISAAAILDFKKDNSKAIPVGNIVVTIKQYQKLIDFLSQRTPFPKHEAEKLVKFFTEIGDNADGNITIKINLDGTENITIKGKSTKELIELFQVQNKAPNLDGSVSSDVQPDAATPPAEVEAKPIQ